MLASIDNALGSMHAAFMQESFHAPKTKIQSLGGIARSQKLSQEERSEIARVAADARWAKDADSSRPIYLKATHEGPLELGGVSIDCAVLEDGTRVMTRAGFVRAIGRKGKVKGGDAYAPESQLPVFLGAENLRPFVTKELTENSQPIFFKMKRGGIAMGYRATFLPAVCDVFLAARNQGGVLKGNQLPIAKQCEILVRGLARVGIAGLVDEATGYQEVRDRLALQEILQKYISGALLEWTKTFPDDFYAEMFRLKGWERNGNRMSPLVGRYTKDLVYQRLAPGVLDQLEAKNPVTEKGYRRHRHHQWLTKDVGHPELSKHLYQLIGMMSVSSDWNQFCKAVDRRFPRLNSTMALPLND